MNPDKLDELLHLGQRIPHHPISRLAGKIAESRFPPLKNLLIQGFISAYNVNMAEAVASNPKRYSSFNSFFTRPLAPDARPIAANESTLISPADGQLSQFGNINNDRLIQAKGKDFSLAALLGHTTQTGETASIALPDYCSHFQNGKFATVYLSPSDYHRVHMPLDGKLTDMVYIPGKLFSVNERTARLEHELFARNERVVCFFDTKIGKVAVILVGAMVVASMATVWSGVLPPKDEVTHTSYQPGQVTLKKGNEMGRFQLGSTVIMLLPQHRFAFEASLELGQKLRMGEAVGTMATTPSTESTS